MEEALARLISHQGATQQETKRKLIHRWETECEHIEAMCMTVEGARRKSARRQGMAAVLSGEAENALVRWINGLIEEGITVSALMIQLEAQSVATHIEVPDGQFRGAWAWQKGYLVRHGLSFRARTRQGQHHPDDMDGAAKDFWRKVAALKAELGVTHVYNADQTGICFEYIPKHTVSARGAATIWVRCGGKDK
jgi:hypothetical protein